MVGTLIDHMIALVVTGAIFVSAIVVVPTLSYVNLLYVDQQQLRNIALDTLKTMLLDTGYPANWGSTYDFDPDQVERFGLALSGSPSFYVLDPDKVQRLLYSKTGFLKYEDIRAKLKLQGYGFSFRITTPFKVTVNDEDFYGESKPITLGNLTRGIEVLVTNNVGRPIPKASVEATLVYVMKNDSRVYIAKANNNTKAVGNCKIRPADLDSIDLKDILDFVIVFKVTVADVTSVSARASSMQGFGEQHVINATMIGDNITLTVPEGPGWEKDSAGARWVNDVVLVTEDEVWPMYRGTKSNEDKITWGGGYWGWSMRFSGLSYCNALFGIFNLNVPNPRRLVLFLGPEPNWRGPRVAACGPNGLPPIADVQRCVTISGMTYIAELTLWKESP